MISSGIRFAPRLYWLALFEIRAFVVRMSFDVNFPHVFRREFFTTHLNSPTHWSIDWLNYWLRKCATNVKKTVDWRMLWKNAIRPLKVMEYNSILPFVFKFRKICSELCALYKRNNRMHCSFGIFVFFSIVIKNFIQCMRFPSKLTSTYQSVHQYIYIENAIALSTKNNVNSSNKPKLIVVSYLF